MRIDHLAQYFNDMTPKPSRSHDNLYQKIWKPEDYPVAGGAQVAAAQEVKQEEKKE